MSQKSYDGKKATLYLIPTPIGNMDDISVRCLNTLKEVEVIFSEDTRVTQQLLNHFEIKKKLVSSHSYNEQMNIDKLLSYLSSGKNVGLVTDRGTPIISDPGYILAKEAINSGYNVVAIPGVTAFVPALIASGLNPQPFLFYGFLSNKSSKRKKELAEIKTHPYTLIFYEAPHRILETLDDIQEVLGDRNISISREISKKFEEIYRGRIDQVKQEIVGAKGEFVIVVDGNYEIIDYNKISIAEHIELFVKEGNDIKTAIKLVAKERNVPKSEIYNAYHKGSD